MYYLQNLRKPVLTTMSDYINDAVNQLKIYIAETLKI